MNKQDYSADILCIGMSSVDISVPGLDLRKGQQQEMLSVNSVSFSVGGDAMNQSVILAKLGAKVRLITGVGTDYPGELILNTAGRFGVDVSDAVISEDRPSAVILIGVPEDGERRLVFVEFNSTSLVFETPPEKIGNAKIISMGSLLAPPFLDPQAAYRTAKKAKETGALLSVDVVFCEYYPMSLDDYADVWPLVDYLFPNDEEAFKLTGETDPDRMADVFLSRGVKNVVIKAGKAGCLFKNREERYLVPVFPVQCIDTTGAGDNFAAGFLTALLDGKSHEECCRFAHAVAGISVTAIGANTGVKSKEQVEEFIREAERK